MEGIFGDDGARGTSPQRVMADSNGQIFVAQYPGTASAFVTLHNQQGGVVGNPPFLQVAKETDQGFG